jgi:hypothetical protein
MVWRQMRPLRWSHSVAPQWSLLVRGSTQPMTGHARTPGPGGAHEPFTHAQSPHVFPHAPQLLGSVWKSAQYAVCSPPQGFLGGCR